MKKFFAVLIAAVMVFTFGQSAAFAQGKILVAYFSRVGEEYGLGVIKKGNTAIVAEIISQKLGADLFEIKPIKSYPVSYDECTKIASREKAQNARPELATRVDNFADYDTIFVGSPVWWGDAAMPVYTFLESYDFAGKNIVPFVTHGGSGLSGIDQRFALVCPNSKILQGLAINGRTAQKNFSETDSKVTDWLKKINFLKQ